MGKKLFNAIFIVKCLLTFIDKGKPLETVGRKANGPFERNGSRATEGRIYYAKEI